MKAIYRWIDSHTGLCRVILILALLALSYCLIMREYVSILTIYILIVFLWFVGIRFILSAGDQLIKEPMEILYQDCDPYPMLEEMERQMANKNDNVQGQVTQINYTMALSQVGRPQEGLDQLRSINIDRFPAISPHIKFVYYNNLGSLLIDLDQVPEALIWLRKAQRIYQDLPGNKAKQRLDYSAQMIEVELLYQQGDHAGALRKLAWINCDSQLNLMSAAFHAARCHVALEEFDKAKEKLQFVVNQGNRLHIVQEAQALLDTLP